jgi:hypothetical protein
MNLSREVRCPIEFRIRVVAAISGWHTFKSVEILLLELRDAEGEHESVLSLTWEPHVEDKNAECIWLEGNSA